MARLVLFDPKKEANPKSKLSKDFSRHKKWFKISMLVNAIQFVVLILTTIYKHL